MQIKENPNKRLFGGHISTTLLPLISIPGTYMLRFLTCATFCEVSRLLEGSAYSHLSVDEAAFI